MPRRNWREVKGGRKGALQGKARVNALSGSMEDLPLVTMIQLTDVILDRLRSLGSRQEVLPPDPEISG